MTPISQIKTFPNKTPIDAVQAKIVAVYEYRKMPSKFGPGEATAQNIELQDVAGNKIRASVWDHPDLTDHKDKEYVFHSGRQGKGIEVRDNTYKGVTNKELSISKAGQLQYVEVYRAANPVPAGTPVPSPAAPAPQTPANGSLGQGKAAGAPIQINGAKVGMALNNATLILAHSGLLAKLGHDKILGAIKDLTMDIIELSNDLESGRAFIEETPAPAPTVEEKKMANQVDRKTGEENKDEEVPF